MDHTAELTPKEPRPRCLPAHPRTVAPGGARSAGTMPKKDSHKGKKGFVFEVTAKCEAMVQADRCAAAGCPRLLRPYPPPRLTAAAAAPANAWSPDARARVRLGAVRLGHCSSLSAAVAGRPRPTVRSRAPSMPASALAIRPAPP